METISYLCTDGKDIMAQDVKFVVKYLWGALSFLATLPEKVQDKIAYNIGKCQVRMDAALFKKLEDTNIWEFRTLYEGNIYRLFAFWDNDGETLVIATHGIIKKSRKTPKKEIAKAEALRKEYFKNKAKK